MSKAMAPALGIGALFLELGLELTVYEAIATLIGLVCGVLWRAGSLYEGEGDFSGAKRDLIVSVFVFGVNLAIALAAVEFLRANVIYSMLTGAVTGATGVRAMNLIKDEAISWIKGKALNNAP